MRFFKEKGGGELNLYFPSVDFILEHTIKIKVFFYFLFGLILKRPISVSANQCINFLESFYIKLFGLHLLNKDFASFDSLFYVTKKITGPDYS